MNTYLQRLSRILMVEALVLFTLQACGGPVPDSTAHTGEAKGTVGLTTKRIMHQGREFIASVRPDGLLIVEGDIIVYPGHYIDLDDPSGQNNGQGVNRSALSIVGHSYRWKEGIVYYTAPSSATFTTAQRNEIRDAMADIQRAAPGIRFAVNTTNKPNFITFTNDETLGCQSAVGRVGAQTINYPDWCFGNFGIHHEILHALGLWHEQSRSDRAAAGVTINWANIQGCPSNATSSADCGSCANSSSPDCCDGTIVACPLTRDAVAHNFNMHSNGKLIGKYDYKSIMHYGAWGFNNRRGSGDGTSISAPTSIGQRSAFSAGDIAKLNALYPTLGKQDFFFTGTGPQDLCWYAGRKEDIATVFGFWSPHPFVTASANRSAYDGGHALRVNTTSVPHGTYRVQCTAKSPFWGQGYAYPNASKWSSSWTLREKRAAAFNATFMDAGLIPVLF